MLIGGGGVAIPKPVPVPVPDPVPRGLGTNSVNEVGATVGDGPLGGSLPLFSVTVCLTGPISPRGVLGTRLNAPRWAIGVSRRVRVARVGQWGLV